MWIPHSALIRRWWWHRRWGEKHIRCNAKPMYTRMLSHPVKSVDPERSWVCCLTYTPLDYPSDYATNYNNWPKCNAEVGFTHKCGPGERMGWSPQSHQYDRREFVQLLINWWNQCPRTTGGSYRGWDRMNAGPTTTTVKRNLTFTLLKLQILEFFEVENVIDSANECPDYGTSLFPVVQTGWPPWFSRQSRGSHFPDEWLTKLPGRLILIGWLGFTSRLLSWPWNGALDFPKLAFRLSLELQKCWTTSDFTLRAWTGHHSVLWISLISHYESRCNTCRPCNGLSETVMVSL